MNRSFLSRADIQPVDSDLSESIQVNSSRFSLNVMTTIRWNFIQDVLSYKEMGINTIGLWRNKLENFGDEKAYELIRDERMNVSSLSWAGGFTGSHGMTFYEAVEDGLQAVDQAHFLGAKSLIIVTGAQGNHIDSHISKTVTKGVLALADYAAEKNVNLALLPMHHSFENNWTFLNSIDQTLDLIDSCNRSNVKMAFSTYHMGCEKDILNRISSVVDFIDLVQIADCKSVPSRENDRCLPGDGIIPVSEIVNELVKNGYQNYFEFDIWSKELWRSDYSQLISQCQSGFTDLITAKQQGISRVYS